MKHQSLRVLALATAGLGFGFFGCAHQQPARVTDTNNMNRPASAVAEQTGPDSQDAKDLAALLKGPIAHFDFDKDQLTSEGQDNLNKLADAMKAHPNARIRISGNCDELGTEEYNLALGQRRAVVAKKYLADLGVDSNRIETVSYGEERPLDPAHTPKAWAANRRDEAQPLVKM